MPAVAADEVPEVLARFPGARTAKVKVAEPGQSLADDVARVNAVRALVPTVRVDANGGWSVDEAVAAAAALTADGPLEYLEQPCATVPELAELRRRVDVPIAADESIRKADDPLHVVRARAADIAVLKVAPLGGVRKLLDIAKQIDIPIVVSSALDSAVGIWQGLLAAGALPSLQHACGLGTGGLVRRGRRRARRAGRRISVGQAGRAGPGPAGGSGAPPEPPAVVDRPRHGLLPANFRVGLQGRCPNLWGYWHRRQACGRQHWVRAIGGAARIPGHPVTRPGRPVRGVFTGATMVWPAGDASRGLLRDGRLPRRRTRRPPAPDSNSSPNRCRTHASLSTRSCCPAASVSSRCGATGTPSVGSRSRPSTPVASSACAPVRSSPRRPD